VVIRSSMALLSSTQGRSGSRCARRPYSFTTSLSSPRAGASLFERIEAHIAVPDRGNKFRTTRQEDVVARLLAHHGHDVERIRKNCGASARSRGTSGLRTARWSRSPGNSKTGLGAPA